MARSHQILAVGGDPGLLATVRSRLVERGHDVEVFDSAGDCARRFSAEGADLVVACLPLREGGGADLLRSLRQIDPRVTVLVTGRDTQIPSAAEAFALDAFEHVDDPLKEMHDVLFAKSPKHRKEDVVGYAKELGLNVARFEADYAAAEAKVKADAAEGDTAGVDATPTIFFNGRKYEGPAYPRYFALWIEEEIAVNR